MPGKEADDVTCMCQNMSKYQRYNRCVPGIKQVTSHVKVKECDITYVKVKASDVANASDKTGDVRHKE